MYVYIHIRSYCTYAWKQCFTKQCNKQCLHAYIFCYAYKLLHKYLSYEVKHYLILAYVYSMTWLVMHYAKEAKVSCRMCFCTCIIAI